MEQINRSALVSFSAQQMYQLVDDITHYPEFVPHCKNAIVIQRNQKEVTAQLEISKGGIAKSFSTINRLTPGSRIHMQLIDGPFKYLSGDWEFTPLSDDACKIELNLEFEFSNKLTSIAFAGIFKHLVQSMVKAFTDRAEKIYG